MDILTPTVPQAKQLLADSPSIGVTSVDRPARDLPPAGPA